MKPRTAKKKLVHRLDRVTYADFTKLQKSVRHSLVQVPEKFQGIDRHKQALKSIVKYIDAAEVKAEYEKHDPQHKNKADRLRVLMAAVQLQMYAEIEGSSLHWEIENALQKRVLLDGSWVQPFCTDQVHDALCEITNRPDLRSEHGQRHLQHWYENRDPDKGPDRLWTEQKPEGLRSVLYGPRLAPIVIDSWQ